MNVEALVTRKTQDLVRFAAEDLLGTQEPSVQRIRRGDLWTFAVAGPDPVGVATRLLEETTLVVNPNVHRYTFDSWRVPPAAGHRVFVRVADRVDVAGAAVLRAAREHRGIREITSVGHSVLWTLDVDTADPAEAERLGRSLVGAGGETAGILANPHAQDAETAVIPAGNGGSAR